MDATTDPLAGASAVDVADAVLVGLLRSCGTALLIEPRADKHSLVQLDATPRGASVQIPVALADAVVARLGVLAGVDPWGVSGRLGRLSVRAGADSGEFLVVLRAFPSGLAGELRRIARPAAAEPTLAVAAAPETRVGAYRLEGELGRGGMGVVHRARHVELGRPVAIKILHRELAADPQIAAQFVREGRAASLAHHPGIVNVSDFGSLPDGRAYLVMELVLSPTLEQAMAGQALEPRRALAIARRIVTALEAAHVRGVVHRDLKPSNVFLDANDEVKIGDFGAAKLLAGGELTATQLGVVVGTPFYMSPEQARGLPTDERTDIYAVGCMLFKMISGEVPYSGATLMDVLFKHVSAVPPPLRSPFGPLPPRVEAVAQRALAKHAEQRQANAGELRIELERALAALPGGARG